MTNSGGDTMEGNSALKKSLKEKNEYFKRMVNLIPARYYLDKETKKTGEKFYKNMKEKAPKQEMKEKSTKRSRKKLRLDPNAKVELSVTELQDGLTLGEEEQQQEKIAEEKILKDAAKDDESSGDEMEALEGVGLEGLGVSDTSQPKAIQSVNVERVKSSASIDDLRRKVREKIETLREQRHAKSLAGNLVTSKKTAKKDKEMNEKKRRKLERFEAIKASREQKAATSLKKKQRTTENESKDKTVSEAKDLANPAGVAFSKFDFDEAAQKGKKGKKRKHKKTEVNLSGRNYEALLQKVQAKKERIDKVKRSDPGKAEDMIREDKWRAALDRAEGKKVRDDPELLKKSIHKKKEKKKHGEKKWKERVDRVDEQKAERQKKREKNLKGRRDARQSKKLKSMQKKGKLLMKDADYS